MTKAPEKTMPDQIWTYPSPNTEGNTLLWSDKYTDGGDHWTRAPLPATASAEALKKIDAAHEWIWGELVECNKGRQWQRTSAPNLPPIFDTRIAALENISECLETIRQSLSSAAHEGWRPIETAPRDGTNILGWYYSSPEVIYFVDGLGWCNGDNAINSEDWTHWLPLPPAPESA